MTENEANQIHAGDVVTYDGHRCAVVSIRVSGIAAPYFRLRDEVTSEYVSLTSYRLCGLITDGNESVECIYCHALIDSADDVPAVDDESGWLAASLQHGANCEWVRTRAHRSEPAPETRGAWDTSHYPDGYNGWENYETWAVALWLDNEQPSQEWAREFVSEYSSAVDAGDALKESMEDDADAQGLLPTGLFGDLLRHALGRVNWRDVAAHFHDEDGE